tara:strand:- start:6090 stop:6281 length:192 start_codon:yes stop_codon:yes gene_type:complete
MSKKFYTIALQYDVDGEPCDPPHHIEDRMVAMMQLMHEIGFGMDVKYGYAEQNILDMIDTGDE